MPEYSVITGCLVLPGMETQGRLPSACGIHAGTGTNETRVDNVDQACLQHGRQANSGQVQSGQVSRAAKKIPTRVVTVPPPDAW